MGLGSSESGLGGGNTGYRPVNGIRNLGGGQRGVRSGNGVDGVLDYQFDFSPG